MDKNFTELCKMLLKQPLNSVYGMMVTPKNRCSMILYLKYKRPVGFIKQRKFIYADTDSIYIKQDEVTK